MHFLMKHKETDGFMLIYHHVLILCAQTCSQLFLMQDYRIYSAAASTISSDTSCNFTKNVPLKERGSATVHALINKHAFAP